ncbi:MAG: glycosyltransferase family 2 protein [Cyanobacteria bacterium CRU_2_1]|nr:glycosyltransferase family 2 protein [Cyanobacteria bacterium RU_5_0]NJR59460.1 glycosyltransferase family 2 protein [Cyanobacteria bacterium CRU_2_1]
MVKKWSAEIYKAVFTHIILIGCPTIFFYCFRLSEWKLIGLHLTLALVYLLGAFMLLLESSSAVFRRFATDRHESKLKSGMFNQLSYSIKSSLGIAGARHPIPKRSVPRCSLLIPAYLPNEQTIILETIEHILLKVHRPLAGLEVILAYNTPINLPIEDDLHALAQLYPDLRLLRVEGSCSKAENLNAAFEIVTGEIICILDADHHPAPDCFDRAWHWFEQGYDVVQGRSIIRNHDQNFLTQLIAIEFEMMYGVAHAAKSFLTNSSIFAGSNGYWCTSVLKQIRFNPAMLTEDIDASMRTLLNGYRIVHDRSIISTELAPVDIRSFWFQRKRWAQGWFEVGLNYQHRVWQSDQFNLWQKVFWTYLLCYCEFYSLVAIQTIPLMLSLPLYESSIPSEINQFLWFSTILSFFGGIYQTLVTAKIAYVRYPILYYIQYVLLLIPYITFKNVIAIVGIFDHLQGNNDWFVTARNRQHSYSSILQKAVLPTSGGIKER